VEAGFACRSLNCADARQQNEGVHGETGFPPLKKSWGHRFHGGPNPVTSVEVVEALPAETAARNASPLRWLGDSP
jgi:hypothetical protein